MSSRDVLPAERGQAAVVELQPVQGADSTEIARPTTSKPGISLNPVGIVKPSGSAACDWSPGQLESAAT
jgi:hypothetical protein